MNHLGEPYPTLLLTRYVIDHSQIIVWIAVYNFTNFCNRNIKELSSWPKKPSHPEAFKNANELTQNYGCNQQLADLLLTRTHPTLSELHQLHCFWKLSGYQKSTNQEASYLLTGQSFPHLHDQNLHQFHNLSAHHIWGTRITALEQLCPFLGQVFQLC